MQFIQEKKFVAFCKKPNFGKNRQNENKKNEKYLQDEQWYGIMRLYIRHACVCVIKGTLCAFSYLYRYEIALFTVDIIDMRCSAQDILYTYSKNEKEGVLSN